jgi:hypothetical protein
LHLLGEVCSSAIDGSGGIGFTFPNEKSANSFRRLGWSEIMNVPLREAKCGQVGITSTVGMSEVPIFDKSVNEIWKHSGMRSGIHRDVEYLNWRYSKPGIQYLKYIVGDFAGYFVLKIFRSEHELKVHLLDLVVKEKEIERIRCVVVVFQGLFDLFTRTRAIRRSIVAQGQDAAGPDFGRRSSSDSKPQ